MNKKNLSIEEQFRQAAHSIEPSQDFSDGLWKQIKNTKQQSAVKNTFFSGLFAHPFLSTGTLAITLLLVVALANPQKVLAAVQSLLEYLPGIGFVEEDENTLYLAEPVSTEEGDFKLVVDQAVSSSQNTIVAYHLEGVENVCFYDKNQLLLPDGTKLLPIGGGVQGQEARIEFFPLPEGVTQAILKAGNSSEPDPACTAPEEWEIEITFDSSEPLVTPATVFDSQAIQTGTSENSSNADVNLFLDQFVELEDAYLLTGHTEWTGERKHEENARPIVQTASVIDANGKTVPLELAVDGNDNENFAFLIRDKNLQSPLTLSIKEMSVWAFPEEDNTFSFEAGSDPQLGQIWNPEQSVEISGRTLTVHKIEAIDLEDIATEGVDAYAFEIEKSSNLSYYNFGCSSPESPDSLFGYSGGETIPLGDNLDRIKMGITPFPTGTVTCEVWTIDYILEGPWNIDWQIPTTP